MISKKKDPSSTFLKGHSPWNGLLGIIAFPNSLDSEDEFTRFYTTVDGNWGHKEFNFDAKSITYLNLPQNDYKAWWIVGKRGEVVEIVGGKSKIEKIKTAGTGPGEKYGYLETITVIDEVLYICGYRRQVYKRVNSRWMLISEPILDKDKSKMAVGFEGIDGTDSKNIYAVGDKGEIWFFDGINWKKEDSPTNQNLSDVRCIDRDNVWICGDHGIVVHGKSGAWNVIHDDEEITENWWSIEEFEDQIYLAGDDVLGILNKDKIQRVKVGLKKNITTGWLHAKDGLLWSIGEDHILVFDGKKWKEIICPDNV